MIVLTYEQAVIAVLGIAFLAELLYVALGRVWKW